MPDNFFHYTDAAAVKSILEKGELWLSDIRFLNDTKEMHDGIVYVLQALKDTIPELDIDKGYILYARDFLQDAIEHHASLGINDTPSFVCSFSKAGDQLSQWRAYGSYAIEFDWAELSKSMMLLHCIYSEEGKVEFAKKYVIKAIEGVARDLDKNSGELSPDHARFLSILVRTASIFKDPHFYEEQEVRCVEDLALPCSSLQFRTSGDILVPYITIPISLSAIKAVHVGPMPKQEIACIAMEALISTVREKHSQTSNTQLQDIQVVASGVPYRH